MNEIVEKEIDIQDMIYEINGVEVMLDSDLARLYECSNGTKTINQAVSRHLDRFPKDFYFQLTWDEFANLKSQFGTSSLNNYGGVRKLPYVFTEQGVAMLASVLRTSVASQVSVDIMRAFVLMKKYISNNLLEQKYINNQVFKNAEEIKMLKESFSKFNKKRKSEEIYFDGQIYDAYSKIIDIFREAKTSLVIIDGYADKVLLDSIKNLNVDVTIITKKNNLLSQTEINKYNLQYNNLTVKYDDTFHDRYFIIDDSVFYHCGSSINKIGTRTFSINLLDDSDICDALRNKINSIK